LEHFGKAFLQPKFLLKILQFIGDIGRRLLEGFSLLGNQQEGWLTPLELEAPGGKTLA